MKLSDFQTTIQCQFECKLKKVVRSVVKDYNKALSRQANKEISFCELPDILVEKLASCDDYETDYTVFHICDMDIRVFDDNLAKALKQLTEKKRNILLMFYFLEMSDTEIGELLNITRCTSHRNRRNSLEEIRIILEREEEEK